MVRTIIKINEEKCDGCGLCATACHEGAISIVNSKAVLLRDDYCDGLGNCLPVCPTGAISFEEREALAFDEAAVRKNTAAQTHLRQWPIQIKLVPLDAPYFNSADLLIAADCAAYAYGNFHIDFMEGKVTLIGCPKLDNTDYSEKLTAILGANTIKSVTVARMEVPCCGGLEHAVKTSIENSNSMIPCQIATLSKDGKQLTPR